MCHTTLKSTLRDTLQEILHRMTLPLDVTTRDGIYSRSLIELVTFLDWNKPNSYILYISRKSNKQQKSLVNTNGYRRSKHQLVGQSSCDVFP